MNKSRQYGLFTDVPGDYVKKPMKECTGKEITAEWLYHLGIPVEDIERLSGEECNCTPTMMPYITAFFMPRSAGDRPDVIPDGSVNAAFLGQFAETPRDTIFGPYRDGSCVRSVRRGPRRAGGVGQCL